MVEDGESDDILQKVELDVLAKTIELKTKEIEEAYANVEKHMMALAESVQRLVARINKEKTDG